MIFKVTKPAQDIRIRIKSTSSILPAGGYKFRIHMERHECVVW